MNNYIYSIAILVLAFLSGCSEIGDDYHRYTGVYLPYQIDELQLTKEQQFDKAGKDKAYFYQNFDKNNFVTSIIFIYPNNSMVDDESAIVKELTERYPKLEQKQTIFIQDKTQLEGRYISFTDVRDFAGKKNQTVLNVVYLTTLDDKWFIKFNFAYQVSIKETAQPVVEQFLKEFWQTFKIKKNDYL
jgi:hypothetical protein